MMWWNDNAGWSAGDWVGMSLMMLVVWALLIVLAVWLVRSLRGQPTATTGADLSGIDRAEQLLAERFARGEIDEDELVRRRRVLRSTSTGRS